MIKRFLLILLMFYTLVGYSQSFIEPFRTHNQSPLIHFFGLPNHNGGHVLSKNEFVFGNYLNIANNATSAKLDNESIYLDGEMYRNDIILKYGLFDKLQLEVEIPLIRHSSGVMDDFISSWHSTFGLPGNAREIMPSYNLAYMYSENENTRVMLNESKLKIGDISLKLSTPLLKSDKHLLALNGFVKFSVGDKNQLIGSGTHDLGFNLDGRLISDTKTRAFTWYYSAGYMRIGSGALLTELLTKNIFFGSVGTAYRINKKWVPKIQMDYHSGFYKGSTTKQLGNKSAQVVIGTDFYLSNKLNLSLSFTEDIIVNTAPDFVLQFGVTYKL